MEFSQTSYLYVISLIYFNEIFERTFYNKIEISRKCIDRETQYSSNFIAYSRCNYIWCQNL